MTPILRYALLPMLIGSAAHAQIAERCNMTPDMDYLLVETFERADEGWTETRLAGPNWKVGHALAPIADHASLQEGRKWFELPDDTPVYCEVNIRKKYRSSPETTDQIVLYIFSLPKDKWWGDRNQRSQGVAGYVREMEQEWARWSDNVVPTVEVSLNQAAHPWLTDHYARLERETEALNAPSAGVDGAPQAAAGGAEHYLAVATSPPPNHRIEPGEAGHFGIGWHRDSQHDGGMAATAECRRQGGGDACGHTATGKSLRGGCVGVAMARWRDRGKDPERAYVVASSLFRDLIARDLRGHCESTAFGGKYKETVVEHSCDVLRVMCAGDI